MDLVDCLVVGLIAIGVICLGSALWLIPLNYQYDVDVASYFELSDKASTLDKKLDYLVKYQDALKENGLDKGESTVFFQTPDNSLEKNFEVLETLVSRLQEIKDMNKSSFEYQTALQQITSQEYCWFPVAFFRQGYYLRSGAWWFSLFPASTYNRCSDSD